MSKFFTMHKVKVLFQNPIDRDIISLLTVSKLSTREKHVWLETLAFMTPEEKEELKKNLEAEVQYEVEVTEKTQEQFLQELEKASK